ncbi:hypothetical protein AAFF_G00155070 [Aldrovandia affinis]|uniref:Uncharacterized protein n=1 Tax=Aldrovandia affinis TaxID=143900 RepID=A0AAD7WXI0_9TELE|nr:hypothetical protein AAFF_G00155070 [Aldrovandia affinis]
MDTSLAGWTGLWAMETLRLEQLQRMGNALRPGPEPTVTRQEFCQNSMFVLGYDRSLAFCLPLPAHRRCSLPGPCQRLHMSALTTKSTASTSSLHSRQRALAFEFTPSSAQSSIAPYPQLELLTRRN